MESRVKVFGHPLHPVLVAFPLGLLGASIIFDIAYLVSYRHNSRWADIAFGMICVGVAAGVIAAVPGLIDYLAIPRGTRAKRIGLLHGIGNVIVLALFAASIALRWRLVEQPPTQAIVLSFVGVALMVVTGWLGGELVDRLGVGVDDGAHLDAPNSLSHRSATSGTPAQRS
jgi:uncharacterized membrane protein